MFRAVVALLIGLASALIPSGLALSATVNVETYGYFE